MITVAAEYRLDNIEVNGTHARGKDCVASVEHGTGKLRTLITDRHRFCPNLPLFTHFKCRNKASNAYAYGAEIGNLINFEQRVELAALFQNLTDLICGDCIQTAAEGIELYKFQIIPRAHKRRGIV